MQPRSTLELTSDPNSSEVWTFDSPDFIAACLDHIELTKDVVKIDGTGRRSLVIIVEHSNRVYRFPRETQDAAEITDYASRHTLGVALGLPVPALHQTQTGAPGQAFLELDFVPGKGLDHPSVQGLAARKPIALGRQLANVLLRLREVSPSHWGLPGVDLVELWDKVARQITELEGHVPREVFDSMSQAAEQAGTANRSAHIGLVHGDLGGVNTRIDGHGRITGVLDWDGAGLGDVAADAAAVAVGIPRVAREILFQTAPILSQDVNRCQKYVDTWAGQGAVWAIANDDAPLLAEMVERERHRMRGSTPKYPRSFHGFSLHHICDRCRDQFCSETAPSQHGVKASIANQSVQGF
jgi:aminoglycoside 2''-phosphotransferase